MSWARPAAFCVSAALLAIATLLLFGSASLLPAPLVAAVRDVFLGLAESPRIALTIYGLSVVSVALAALRLKPATSGVIHVDHEAIVSGVESTTAGADVDAVMGSLSERSSDEAADDLRAELREAAVTVLHQSVRRPTEGVEAAIDSGEWTEDRQAAAFLAEEAPPLAIRFREWLSPKPATALRVHSTIRAIERHLKESTSALEADGIGVLDLSSGATGGADPTFDDETAVAAERRVTEKQLDDLRGNARLIEHWGPLVTAGLFGVALGLVTASRAPVVLGIVAIAYTVPKYVAQPPLPTLRVRRTVADDQPLPGDRVTVRIEVENIGDRTLPDLRVIDRPPSALTVTAGSPSILTALRPGETDEFTYEFRAKRGEFAFGEATLHTQGLGNVRQQKLTLDLETRISCHTLLEEFELHEQAALRIGSVKTDEGGSGVEFHSTREYREGDPLKRVDWNHLAKANELTTITFREHRAATVTLVLDRRDAARVAPESTELDGVDLCVYAAERTFIDLHERGIDVGLVAIDEGLTSIETGSGAAKRARIQTQLRAATDRYAAALGADQVAAGAALQTQDSTSPDDIQSYVPMNAQIIALSPLTDDYGFELIQQLRAFGTPVTLLSPDVIGDGSVGARLRRIQRESRLEAIRDTGTRVIDWSPDEAIETAVARATAHWN